MAGVSDYFKHLSVSNVNGFISWRSKWYLERIAKAALPMGPEAHRGTAVEHGVTHGLIQGAPLDACVSVALQDYDTLAAGLDLDDAAECRKPIPALVSALIDALKPLGKVTAVQRRVEKTYPEFPGVSWIGFADIIFEDSLCVDIKTRGRTPSEFPGDWGRQGAFYNDCLKMPVKFVCAIPLAKETRVVKYDLAADHAATYLEQLLDGAKLMDRLLSLPASQLADVFTPSPDEWFLKDTQTFNAAKEVWPILAKKAA